MRHKIGYKKLNRTSEHRKALIKNMLNSLIKYEQITTTLPKAKVLRPEADKIITLGKKGNLQNTRTLFSKLQDMKSANISPGKPKWTGTAFCESILKDYGFNFDTIKKNGGVVHMVSYKESVALMKDGQADVFMAATSVPQASFIELEKWEKSC